MTDKEMEHIESLYAVIKAQKNLLFSQDKEIISLDLETKVLNRIIENKTKSENESERRYKEVYHQSLKEYQRRIEDIKNCFKWFRYDDAKNDSIYITIGAEKTLMKKLGIYE